MLSFSLKLAKHDLNGQNSSTDAPSATTSDCQSYHKTEVQYEFNSESQMYVSINTVQTS